MPVGDDVEDRSYEVEDESYDGDVEIDAPTGNVVASIEGC